MKVIFSTLFILTFLVSCYDNPQFVDKSLLPIPQDSFELILYENTLAIELGNNNALDTMFSGKGEIRFLDSILAFHNYNRKQYDSTFIIWAANPKQLSEVYERVIKRFQDSLTFYNNKRLDSTSVK